METLLKNKILIAILLFIIVLVSIRLFGSGHFKSDTKKWFEPSANKTNLITEERLKAIDGKKLYINLSPQGQSNTDNLNSSISIPADSVLTGKYLKTIKNFSGAIILRSDNITLSSKVWMILSQMGISNLYILVRDNEAEVLKYKFRPDTMTGPEL